MSRTSWSAEFKTVLSCQACSLSQDRNLLRDDCENVPQPGYIGKNYEASGLVLVGQNPGTPKTLLDEDKPYTASLRGLRDDPTNRNYDQLIDVLLHFIPKWPVHGNYFPLSECGFTLEDIAYLNIVRCRTSLDKKPSVATVSNCVTNHFNRWLDLLAPRVIIFIGKWAAQHGAHEVARRGIPHAYMNRQRSLSTAERIENRAAVVKLVRANAGAARS